MNMKRIYLFLFVSALCLFFCACDKDAQKTGAASSKEAAACHITAVLPNDGTCNDMIAQGIEAAAAEAPVKVKVSYQYAQDSKAQEEAIFSAILPEKVDGVVALPLSSDESLAGLSRVCDRGIPVSLTGTSSGKVGFAVGAFSPPKDAQLGALAGKAAKAYLAEKLSGKANLVILEHNSINRTQSTLRVNGFLDELKGLEGVQVVEDLGATTAKDISAALPELLKANNSVNLIFCTTARATLAAQQAVANANLVGKIALFGIEGNVDITSALRSKDNAICAVATADYYQEGYLATKALLEHLLNKAPAVYGEIPALVLTPQDTATLDAFDNASHS